MSLSTTRGPSELGLAQADALALFQLHGLTQATRDLYSLMFGIWRETQLEGDFPIQSRSRLLRAAESILEVYGERHAHGSPVM